MNSLPKPQLDQNVKVNGCQAVVTVKNMGKTPAVFLRVNLKGADGEQILPVIYSDNYFTLMPGEVKTINIGWKQEDSRGQQPLVEITSIN